MSLLILPEFENRWEAKLSNLSDFYDGLKKHIFYKTNKIELEANNVKYTYICSTEFSLLIFNLNSLNLIPVYYEHKKNKVINKPK